MLNLALLISCIFFGKPKKAGITNSNESQEAKDERQFCAKAKFHLFGYPLFIFLFNWAVVNYLYFTTVARQVKMLFGIVAGKVYSTAHCHMAS
jgi:hypothetical protein